MELEAPLLKVPLESLSKSVRSAARITEREIGHAAASAKELAKRKALTRSEALKSLDAMVTRLTNTKRKLEQFRREAEGHEQRCRLRIEHLRVAPGTGVSAEDAQRWNLQRVDRTLVDFMLRGGMYDSARMLAESAKIEALTDLDVFVEAQRIARALENHDCGPALTWSAENRTKLRKLKSTLEFELRLQEFVELVRSEKLIDAIAYARKHLAPLAGTNMHEIQQAMATLAFLKDTECATYRAYFDPQRWTMLVKMFKRDNQMLHNLTTESLLKITLQAGISALKTPFCYADDSKNINCPVCQPPFNCLGEGLPFSHRVHSCLVCRISGQIMDDDNPPMYLPNGNVYSHDALAAMAAKDQGLIVDPRTASASAS